MVALTHHRIDSIIEELERKYNGDNDTIPGTPTVTWTDYQLLDIVSWLAERVYALEQEMEERNSTTK